MTQKFPVPAGGKQGYLIHTGINYTPLTYD
jgi:hypothetical protein